MAIRKPEFWRKAAKAHADTISKVLWTGFLLSIAVLIVRLIGHSTVKVLNVEIPVDAAWIPLGVLTVLHAIFAEQFVQSARRFWELTEPKVYSELFMDIVAEGGYFMRGMTPRILPETGGPAPMGNELATWLTHVAAICLFFALVPTSGFFSLRAVPAYLFTYVNWMAGSRWAIALSELAVRKEFSSLLSKRLRSKRRVPTIFDEDDSASGNSESKTDGKSA